MRQRFLRFSVLFFSLSLCFLLIVPTAAATGKKRKKSARKATASQKAKADLKTARKRQESYARLATWYQLALLRSRESTIPTTDNFGVSEGMTPPAPARPSREGGALLVGDPEAPGLGPASVTAGQLIISEFRTRGINGNTDEFIEIYNDSGTDHTVTATSGTGYGVAASDGILRCTIPNGTVFPARGHFLCVNSVGYSLAGYAAGDATYTTDITAGEDPDGMGPMPALPRQGIALFNNNSGGANFSLANRFDAVGPVEEANTLYKEGVGLPNLTPFSSDYAWVRDECGKFGSIATPGGCIISTPKDTNDNAADFFYVDTFGTNAGAGQNLGAPGPQNLASAIQRNSSFQSNLLDSSVPQSNPPNRIRDFTPDAGSNSTFGTLHIRRRFVNNTGANITRLRFRIIDLTTFPAPSGTADLRPRNSTLVVVAGINDSATCLASNGVATTPCNVNVQGTFIEDPPPQPSGGGFNSTMSAGTITLGTPLANGASINLIFLMGIQQTGNFRVRLNIETLP